MTGLHVLTRQCRPLLGPLSRPLCLAVALAVVLGLKGCVMVPRTIETFDPDCRILRREMVLEPKSIGIYSGCRGDTCAAVLAAAGLVTAASVVVSGSIAIVGNMVYWFEHQKKCERGPAA